MFWIALEFSALYASRFTCRRTRLLHLEVLGQPEIQPPDPAFEHGIRHDQRDVDRACAAGESPAQ